MGGAPSLHPEKGRGSLGKKVSERETFWKRESWGVQPQSSHMEVQGLEVSRMGALGSGSPSK